MRSTTKLSPKGTAALKLAAQGFLVFPCHSVKLKTAACTCNKEGNCLKKAKHPHIKGWPQKASDDEEQIRQWWSKWPNANVAILTGHLSELAVLDVDPRHGGLETLKELTVDHPEILDTFTVTTGGGGLHLYFRHPGHDTTIRNRQGILPGFDVRGDGGYVIAPPSIHKSGRRYKNDNSKPIADLPDVVLKLMTADNPSKSANSSQARNYSRATQERFKQLGGGRGMSSSDSINTSQNQRNDDLVPLDSDGLDADQKTDIKGAIRMSIPKGAGRRNQQTFELARRLQSVPGIDWKSIDVNSIRPLVQNWHQRALQHSRNAGFTIQGDFTETWDDFRYGWDKVRCPVGMTLNGVVERIQKNGTNYPPDVSNAGKELGYAKDRDMMLLLSLCFELYGFHEGLAFFLAASEASKRLRQLGSTKDRHWCNRRLRQLCDDGVLRILEPGKPGTGGKGQSTSYLWTWQTKKTTTDLSWLDDPPKLRIKRIKR
jgi:hypothetical protein